MTSKFYTERINSVIMKLTSWMQEDTERKVRFGGSATYMHNDPSNEA